MFLDLPDSDPYPSLFCTNPNPSINKQKNKKNLDFYYFVTSFVLFIYENLCEFTFKK